MTINYHEGHRRLQDQFDSRRIADRLDEVTARTAFTDDDKTFIEGRIFFFVATATAAGHPTCNLKGGAPGFVRVIAPDVLAFPDYDGNGMFLSLGNIAPILTSVSCSSISKGQNGCASTARRPFQATIR